MLSPAEIANRQFNRKFEGYNVDEVNDFLNQIFHDYSFILKDNQHLKRVTSENQKELKQFHSMKRTLSQSILVAQQTADKVKIASKKKNDARNQDAEQHAQDIIANAKDRANGILGHAVNKANSLSSQTIDLSRGTKQFRSQIEALAKQQLAFIQSNDWSKALKNGAQQYKHEQNNARHFSTDTDKSKK